VSALGLVEYVWGRPPPLDSPLGRGDHPARVKWEETPGYRQGWGWGGEFMFPPSFAWYRPGPLSLNGDDTGPMGGARQRAKRISPLR